MDNNEKKSQFHEALSFLVESANINNGTLTIDEIKSALDDVITDDSMYQLVYDYLLENKISINGYIPVAKKFTTSGSSEEVINISNINVSTEENDNKEQTFLNMYYDDLENIITLSAEEECILLEKLLKDSHDKTTINSLIEANLKTVLSLAESFRDKGVSHGDLLQEGNLGLMEGIMTYKGNTAISEFHSHIENTIKNALNDAILEQNT